MLTMPRKKNTQADFWMRVEKDPSGCWLWTGKPTADGYGQFVMDGTNRHTHRWAWIFAHGEAPVGQVNRSCGVPACVNPDHLYVGTQSDNIFDSVEHGTHRNAAKTHCPQGHPYDEENTLIEKTRTGVGRRCRQCHRDRARAQYRRKMKDPGFREAERQRAEAKNRRNGYKPRGSR